MMKMKRQLGLAAVAAIMLALPTSHFVLGKGHVPAGKEQVCHKGSVLTIAAGSVADHVAHGYAFIDKRTQIPPFFTGDSCP